MCNPYNKSVHFPGCNLENHNLLVWHLKRVMHMFVASHRNMHGNFKMMCSTP